jgi:hypothetical protein
MLRGRSGGSQPSAGCLSGGPVAVLEVDGAMTEGSELRGDAVAVCAIRWRQTDACLSGQDSGWLSR